MIEIMQFARLAFATLWATVCIVAAVKAFWFHAKPPYLVKQPTRERCLTVLFLAVFALLAWIIVVSR